MTTYLDEWARYTQKVRDLAPVETPPPDAPRAIPQPINGRGGGNALRPNSLDAVIGQRRVVLLLMRVIEATKRRYESLDHMLFAGPSGTGKTTLAIAVANEMGVPIYQVGAPVDIEQLLELREVMTDRSILFVDEIHLQTLGDRRGRSASTQAEIFYNVMEDRVIVDGNKTLKFPKITVIGATTDEGMLPDAFVGRFPMRPSLEPYSKGDMERIGQMNAKALGLVLRDTAGGYLAGASRSNPRQMNDYLRNAAVLSEDDIVDLPLAMEVVRELNQTEDDGLTADMSRMLVFLYTRCRRVKGDGEVVYQAGMGTLATALGKSRDQKVVALRIEPTLIERGLLSVGHGGRLLTEAGAERARELIDDQEG